MNSKYVDTTAIIQVIGNIFNNLSLLEFNDKYFFLEEDFPNEFHKIVFGALYNLHDLGVNIASIEAVSDYLEARPKYFGIFNSNKGPEWLIEVREKAMPAAFDYYYQRMKKMTLLREYDKCGIDVSFIYDPDNILDTKKKQRQEENLDNMSLQDIVKKIDEKIETIKMTYVDDSDEEPTQAGEGALELIQEYKEHPEVGVPLFGPLINTITRGARLKKFYLRSAATGVGKTRSMIADACYIACDKIYDENFGWIKNGTNEPAVYITTEQEKSEIQTMMLAFLSDVDEEHILNGKYEGDEEERVIMAAKILQNSPLFIYEMPDFSLQDVENRIKKSVRDLDAKYIFMDYIHSSLKILEEITRRSGGIKLREDNILFMMSIKLKDVCNQLGVFIMSATQLNADYQTSETPDQNLLRGAKSIADKIDYGAIILGVKNDDLEKLSNLIGNQGFETPTLKISIYKNRRSQYKGIYLWCKARLGTCKIIPMFCTGWDYELRNVDNVKIIVENESAF